MYLVALSFGSLGNLLPRKASPANAAAATAPKASSSLSRLRLAAERETAARPAAHAQTEAPTAAQEGVRNERR